VPEWRLTCFGQFFFVLLILWVQGFSLHMGRGIIHLLPVDLVVFVVNLPSGRCGVKPIALPQESRIAMRLLES